MMPATNPARLQPLTTPWLTNFRSAYLAADAASHRAEMDRLKLHLIGKLATVRDDWYELIEAAKCVSETDKRRS